MNNRARSYGLLKIRYSLQDQEQGFSQLSCFLGICRYLGLKALTVFSGNRFKTFDEGYKFRRESSVANGVDCLHYLEGHADDGNVCQHITAHNNVSGNLARC